jgi:hypothetical protein
MPYKGSSSYHGPSRDTITENTGNGNDLTIDEDTQTVFADTNDSALTVTLPSAAERDGKVVTVVDRGGNAGSNAITVTAASGNDINGSDQDLTISTNNAALTLRFNGDDSEWIAQSSAP